MFSKFSQGSRIFISPLNNKALFTLNLYMTSFLHVYPCSLTIISLRTIIRISMHMSWILKVHHTWSHKMELFRLIFLIYILYALLKLQKVLIWFELFWKMLRKRKAQGLHIHKERINLYSIFKNIDKTLKGLWIECGKWEECVYWSS